jgi:hypothetical protein
LLLPVSEGVAATGILPETGLLSVNRFTAGAAGSPILGIVAAAVERPPD